MSSSRRDLAELLARTLASLVTAKVEGLLGDVRIAGPAGKNLSILANHAGCDLIEAENEAAWLGLALQEARGPNVFLLRCGRIPEAGFIEEAGDFLASSQQRSTARGVFACPARKLHRTDISVSRAGRRNSSPPAISCWPRRAAAFQSSRALLLPRPYFLRAPAASADRVRCLLSRKDGS